MLKLIYKNKTRIFVSDFLSSLNWLNHGFTTRIGGISKKEFEGLNLYSYDKNEFKNVIENRKILAKDCNFDYKSLVLAKQIHSNNVHIVQENDKGKGALDHNFSVDNIDAFIINKKNIPIMLLFADCLPIIVVDLKNKVTSLIHAGWKGTYYKILINTLEKMENDFSSNKKDLFITFGICINSCCFEIKEDVKLKLEEVNYKRDSFEFRNNKIYANLQKINSSQAINFGVPEKNIEYNNLCTFCNEDLFFSYRRNNNTGRHGAFLEII
jgi:hypothetical protein